KTGLIFSLIPEFPDIYGFLQFVQIISVYWQSLHCLSHQNNLISKHADTVKGGLLILDMLLPTPHFVRLPAILFLYMYQRQERKGFRVDLFVYVFSNDPNTHF